MYVLESFCGVWTGGFACPGERTALLACVVTGGYHFVATYHWQKDGSDFEDPDECYPIIYVSECGVYTCSNITSDDHTDTLTFEVNGEYVNN